MSEVIITVVGNVATDPRLDETKKGEAFASFRLACNGQRYDTRTRSWVDDDTSFYTVYCWRSPLADNIKASLRKGDPVVVHGRLRNREWRDDNNVVRVSPEITARSLGHDLYRGTSSFTKVSRQPILPEEDDAVDNVRAIYYSGTNQPDGVDPRTGEIFPGGLGTDLKPDGEIPAGGDRMPGDRSAGGESSPGAITVAADSGPAADPRADVSSIPRQGGRPRREKAGVGG